MSDASSPLGSEGIPYAFETLYVSGQCQSLGETCAMAATATVRRLSMPVENEIVRFP
jgi:hypothetical protein